MNILIDNLSKSYGSQKAVDGISFEVKTGEILGFLGPNGAGKTTTMKMITQYINADSGSIKIDNLPIQEGNFRVNVGYLPEHNPLYQEMSVIDYLRFCAELQNVSKANVSNQIRKMVRLCGLDREKHKKINELSKGYKQRVGLAQAMIHEPEILILDEPTTGLDPNQIVEIRELIKNIGKEKTVILSTHILPEVEATCDRILIINKGKIVADGTANTLRDQAKGNQIVRARIESESVENTKNALIDLSQILGVKVLNEHTNRFELQSSSNMDACRSVFRLCQEKNWPILEMIPVETKLEDIFRDLTLN